MSDERLYQVINHACRGCGGRLLKSASDASGKVIYRCADCGVSTISEKANKVGHLALCFCGARLPGVTRVVLRCVVNHEKGLEMPEEIIARREENE